MFNISLSISILISALFPLGIKVLLTFISYSEIRTLGTVMSGLITLSFKYFFVAILLYAVARIMKLDTKIQLSSVGQKLLIVANTVIVSYGFIRIAASTVEGGGGLFVVTSFAPFIFWPMWICILIGLFKTYKQNVQSK